MGIESSKPDKGKAKQHKKDTGGPSDFVRAKESERTLSPLGQKQEITAKQLADWQREGPDPSRDRDFSEVRSPSISPQGEPRESLRVKLLHKLWDRLVGL